MDVNNIVKPLDDLAASYGKNPALKRAEGNIRGLIEDIERTWGGKSPGIDPQISDMPIEPKLVRARQLRELVTTIQSRGFGGDVLDPKAAEQLQRDIAGRLKGTLDDYLSEHGALDGINDLNKEISVLLDLQKAAEKRAAAAALKPVPLPVLNKTGKITAQELDELVSEVAAQLPRKPKIISKFDDIEFGKKTSKVLERVRDELGSLLDSKLPPEQLAALRAKEGTRELVDLAGKAAIERARKEQGPKTGLRALLGEQTEKAGGSVDTTAAFTAAAVTMNPLALALKPVGWGARKVAGAAANVAKGAERKASEALAKLVKEAKAGNARKQTFQDALEAGVSVGTALGVLKVGQKTYAWAKDFGRDE
jgi:hypothetical protein